MEVDLHIPLVSDFRLFLPAVLILSYSSAQTLSAHIQSSLSHALSNFSHINYSELESKSHLLPGFVVNERVYNFPYCHKYGGCIHNKHLPQSFWVVILKRN